MQKWLRSPSGVMITSALSLLTFILRSLLDWRYVYTLIMDMTPGMVAGMLFWNILMVAGWVWALLAFQPDRKAPYRTLMGLNLFQVLFNGLMASFLYCPTPCPTLWPVGEIIIWSNTISGFIALISLALYKRYRKKLDQIHA